MEEKVTMSGQTAPEKTKESKQLSYDELKNAAIQLSQQYQEALRQNEELRREINSINGIEARLHYLFEVLKSGIYFDNDYTEEVANEIKDILTIRKEEPKEDLNPENTEE